jgi:hypothetical protein
MGTAVVDRPRSTTPTQRPHPTPPRPTQTGTSATPATIRCRMRIASRAGDGSPKPFQRPLRLTTSSHSLLEAGRRAGAREAPLAGNWLANQAGRVALPGCVVPPRMRLRPTESLLSSDQPLAHQTRDPQIRECGRLGGSRHTATWHPHCASDVTNAIVCCGIGSPTPRLYIS